MATTKATKTTRPRKASKKRGRKEERLMIKGDPADALARLLRTRKPDCD